MPARGGNWPAPDLCAVLPLAHWALLAAACTGEPLAADRCSFAELRPGEHYLALEHDRMDRDYLLYQPTRLSGRRKPLVLSFHGYTYSARYQEAWTEMSDLAEAEGFVVGYPSGYERSWNAGENCCGAAIEEPAVDDVGFVVRLVREISDHVCIDPDRVYATGFSNGACLCHRLACEAAGVFAAVAPVAGVMPTLAAPCRPLRPVPILLLMGTNDVYMPWEGGGPLATEPVESTRDGWIERNDCSGTGAVVPVGARTDCTSYADCEGDAEVQLCTIQDGAHCWPGGVGDLCTTRGLCPNQPCDEDLSATDLIWGFLSRFRRDPSLLAPPP